MATGGARTGTCSISGAAYRCSILLGPGRWTIATSALGASGAVVSQSTRRVTVRRVAMLPVTG